MPFKKKKSTARCFSRSDDPVTWDDVNCFFSSSNENSSQQGQWIILKNGDTVYESRYSFWILNSCLMVWAQQTKSLSSPLCCSDGRNVRDRYLKSWANKTQTICGAWSDQRWVRNNIYCNLCEHTFQTDVKGFFFFLSTNPMKRPKPTMR